VSVAASEIVDDRSTVERVSAHSDHRLMIDRSRSAGVLYAIYGSGVGLKPREQAVPTADVLAGPAADSTHETPPPQATSITAAT
jgi:hypothetical protein